MALTAEADGFLRGRKRRRNFPEHLETTCDLIGYDEDDEVLILKTRAFIHPHVDEIANDVYRELRSHPEAASYLAAPEGGVGAERGVIWTDTFRQWLVSAIDLGLDGATAEHLASSAHEQVRPRDGAKPTKARLFLLTMGRVQSSLFAILAANITDPIELGACAAAWSKRLWIHLDLFLAVHSATERNAHWY